jgi:3-mercaptopyruvate sulfurtransferase SseA
VALYVIEQGMDPANVYVLLGGLAGWKSAGYATSAGDD